MIDVPTVILFRSRSLHETSQTPDYSTFSTIELTLWMEYSASPLNINSKSIIAGIIPKIIEIWLTRQKMERSNRIQRLWSANKRITRGVIGLQRKKQKRANVLIRFTWFVYWKMIKAGMRLGNVRGVPSTRYMDRTRTTRRSQFFVKLVRERINGRRDGQFSKIVYRKYPMRNDCYIYVTLILRIDNKQVLSTNNKVTIKL